MGNSNIYVPPEQRDARYYIWNVLFQCRVPYNARFSVEHLRNFGYPTSMDRRQDQQIQNAPEDCMLCINQMFEYWKDGIQVKLVKYSDSKKVYEHIEGYLAAWKRELEIILDVSKAPLEDLMQLDEFARVVYDKAKYNFPKTEIDSILSRRMGSLLKFGKGNILIDRPDKNPVPEEPEKDPYPERQSHAGYFENFMPKKNE